MNFLEELAVSVRDNTVALAKMVVATDTTEAQQKTKEFLEKVYVITSNLFCLGIIITYVVFVALRFYGQHPGLPALSEQLWHQLSYPIIAGAILAVIAAFLLLLRGVLYLFKFIKFTELTKFYCFIELVHLGLELLRKPDTTPTLFLQKMCSRFSTASPQISYPNAKPNHAVFLWPAPGGAGPCAPALGYIASSPCKYANRHEIFRLEPVNSPAP